MGNRQAYDVPGTRDKTVASPATAAADASTTYVIFEAPVNCKIEKVRVVPGAAVTGQDTNTKNLNLIDRGTNGAGATELANYDLTSGNDIGVAGYDLYSPASALSVSTGNQLGLQVEQVGAGMALSPLAVTVEFSPN